MGTAQGGLGFVCVAMHDVASAKSTPCVTRGASRVQAGARTSAPQSVRRPQRRPFFDVRGFVGAHRCDVGHTNDNRSSHCACAMQLRARGERRAHNCALEIGPLALGALKAVDLDGFVRRSHMAVWKFTGHVLDRQAPIGSRAGSRIPIACSGSTPIVHVPTCRHDAHDQGCALGSVVRRPTAMMRAVCDVRRRAGQAR